MAHPGHSRSKPSRLVWLWTGFGGGLFKRASRDSIESGALSFWDGQHVEGCDGTDLAGWENLYLGKAALERCMKDPISGGGFTRYLLVPTLGARIVLPFSPRFTLPPR
jgi:hypothetical protein